MFIHSKKFNIIIVFYFFIFGFIILSCSSEFTIDDTTRNLSEKNVYDLHIEKLDHNINSFKMTHTKRQTLRDLIHNESIDFNLLTTLLIEEQVNYFNLDVYKDFPDTDFNYLNDIINKIAPSNEKDPYTIKKIYDTNIKNLLGISFTYNTKANNLPYSFKTSSINQYSSMILNLIIWRLNYSSFKTYSPVIIFTRDSVYPGYIKQIDGKLKLIGIDTLTSEENPSLFFGDLLNYNGPTVRIVDAELFTIMEIFKNNILNITNLSKEILEKTALKYGFTLNNQYAVGKLQQDNITHDFNYYTYSNQADKTPFSFK